MKFPVYIEIIRPNVCILSVLGLIVGNVISGFNLDALPLAALTVFLISGAGNTVNDYFDAEIDAINKSDRPIPSGRISKRGAWWEAVLLYSLAVVTAFFVNVWFFFLALFNSLFSYNYAEQSKKGGFVSNAADSWLVASTFLAGGLINESIGTPIIVVSIMAFFANTAREIFKDIEDMRGDKKTGLGTLPLMFGKLKARITAQLLVIVFLIFAVLVFIFQLLPWKYLYATIPSALLFIYASMKKASRAQKLFKAGMYIGLFSYLIASLIG